MTDRTSSMNPSTVLIGIDLAWGERNPDGVTVLPFGEGLSRPMTSPPNTFNTRGDDELFAALASADGAERILVAVDAPLICPNPTGSRPVDKECTRRFGRCHAGCYPANQRLCRRPLRIAEGLVERGYQLTADSSRGTRIASEVYPHPATIQLFGIEKTIKYKKGLVASKRAGFLRYQSYLRDCLARELPEWLDSAPHRTLLETPWSKPIEDQTDSVLCALIAYLHLRFGENRTEVLGNDETGHILLPRPIGGAET